MNNNLRVDLNPREDRSNNIFYLGKLQYPGFIDCSAGVTFLIFLNESGDEEIQIASTDQQNNIYSAYIKKPDRLKVALEPRIDQYGKTFYICKLRFKGLIDCRQTVSFMVFTASAKSKELQIVAPIVNAATPPGVRSKNTKSPEIVIKQRRVHISA